MDSFTLMVKPIDKRENQVYLSLGTNLGDRELNLRLGLRSLSELAGQILEVSSVYESSPWGDSDLLPFYNAVVLIQTNLSPSELLICCKQIEKELGRDEKTKSGYLNRPIDLDILTYDQLLINSEKLTIPHPFLQDRKFVLIPFSEIAENFYIQSLNKSIQELVKSCNDKGSVRLVIEKNRVY